MKIGKAPSKLDGAFRNAANGLAKDEEGNLTRTTDGGLTWTPVLPTGPLHVTGLDNVPGTSTYVSVGITGEIGTCWS
ncbi:hypothetical protein MTX78_09545 [Hymenobacter tibetensis]|uniref:Photosynthesis system II assembly factor Ycf48/Hcf136-like domain-containing protein n=1 Tax=Hymenobacter tibetensis TaxID=497967 RepID=A0ABY4D2T0_9BACT|nr:hypothetical protein [Hymenobacter tibetensis]UOG76825.1 hypothetical protein MTX78_09545 [Hymenobacter tibetensis]